MKLGCILDRPSSFLTVDPVDFIKQSSATSPRATAGVFWLTQDGPFLEPPPGNLFMWEKSFYQIWTHGNKTVGWGELASALVEIPDVQWITGWETVPPDPAPSTPAAKLPASVIHWSGRQSFLVLASSCSLCRTISLRSFREYYLFLVQLLLFILLSGKWWRHSEFFCKGQMSERCRWANSKKEQRWRLMLGLCRGCVQFEFQDAWVKKGVAFVPKRKQLFL